MPTRIVQVRVETEACAFNEACNVVPEVFAFTNNDYPAPVVPTDADQHFDSRRDSIIKAVLSCPVAALSLHFADGRIITSDDFVAADDLRTWQEY